MAGVPDDSTAKSSEIELSLAMLKHILIF